MKGGFVIYNSSAGSGKTFTLVLSYLKIVIKKPHHYKNILAITFTNKATEEMKTRIIDALTELATGKKTAYFELLTQYFSSEKPPIDIQKNAEKALFFILKDYSNFSVSTIESFFQRVLRAFSKEMNLPLGYDIEMRSDFVLKKVTDDLLLDAGVNQSVTKIIQDFVENKLADDRSWKVDKEIQGLAKEILKEKYQQHIKLSEQNIENIAENRVEALQSLTGFVFKVIADFEMQLREFGQQGKRIAQKYGVSFEDFKGKSRSVPKIFEYWNEEKTNANYLTLTKTRTQSLVDINEWLSKAEQADAVKTAAAKELQYVLHQANNFLTAHAQHYHTAKAAAKTIFSFSLLNDLDIKLSDYRKENGQLMISDTNFLLQSVIKNDFDPPLIYEKIGTRYQYYLIDEFQDTSLLQWKNLYPLLHEALASNPHNVTLLVGDVKQAIYRWRGGESQLMAEKAPAEMLNIGFEPQIENLNANWRTAAEIVNFNNIFFDEAKQLIIEKMGSDAQCASEESQTVKGNAFIEHHLDISYNNIIQSPRKTHVKGYVNVSFLPVKSKWKLDTNAVLSHTLGLMLSLQAEGFPLSEITILVRKNHEATLIAEFLQKNHIKITSTESLLLNNYPAVQLIISLLHFLLDEKNEIAAAAAFYYYQVFTAHSSVTYHNELVTDFDKNRIFEHAFFKDMMHKHRADFLRLPLFDCVEKIMHLIPELLTPNAYIQGFLDIILEYNQSQDAGVSGFLEWWETAKNNKYVTLSKEPDAVNIMTIHKAKGLEFPILLIPFCDWGLAPKSDSIFWVKPDTEPYNSIDLYPLQSSSTLNDSDFSYQYQEEAALTALDNLNVLYVAFTRPKYRMYIFSPEYKPPTSKPKTEESFGKVGELMWCVIPKILQKVTDTEYETGVKIPYETLAKDEKEGESNALPKHVPSNYSVMKNWNDILHVKTSGNAIFQTVKKAREAVEEKVHWGVMLHTAFSYLKKAEDVPYVLTRLAMDGILMEKYKSRLTEIMQQAITHPIAKDWYSDNYKVKNECTLILPDGKTLRPDRVIVRDKHAIVIDYKTGTPSAHHASQLQSYIDILNSMSYESVKGYLYYVESQEVEEVLQHS